MKTTDKSFDSCDGTWPAAVLPCAALLLFVSLTTSLAAAPPGKAFSVAPHGELRFLIPEGWKDRVKPSPANMPPTIELYSAVGGEFVVLMTPIHPGTSQPRWENLRPATEALARPVVSQSVEQKADIKPLKGQQTDGYYFSVTDSAPAPGEYKYMTQGLGRVGELVIRFTILSNDPTQKIRDTALEIVRTASHDKAALTTREIPVAGQGWKLRVFDPGLVKLQQQSDTNQFTCRSATGTGFNFSVFVEQPSGAGTQHGDVFKHYWSQSQKNPMIEQDSIKIEQNPKYVKVSYRIATMPHVNYYFAYKGRWVDVHISKLPFAKGDETLFASFDQLLAYSE